MENENDIIYDLDAADAEKTEILEIPEESDESDMSDQSDQSDQSYQSEQSDQSDQSEPSDATEEDEKSPAEAELQKMLDEMGAETLVEIIKDNRNAAIRQIISEVQSAQPRALGSGTSITSTCQSIFDLAAMA
ncbi:MAG: hypothetical protein K2K32_04580 [Muribaculaceae bacterium]|nr:hypothetical protein [Muribaculaceae bacterium]